MSGQGVVSGVVNPSPDPFPSGKGSLVSRNRNLLRNHLQHPVDISQHLVVPEADHPVAVSFDDAGAVGVGGALRVLPAVEFDGEAQTAAGEVGDEIADGKLPRELRALEATGAQVQPQALFRFGCVITKVARNLCEAIFNQRRTPIPTLPQGEGLLIASRA